MVVFFFQAEDGIRDLVRSRGLGDVYKRQVDGCGGMSDLSFVAARLKHRSKYAQLHGIYSSSSQAAISWASFDPKASSCSRPRPVAPRIDPPQRPSPPVSARRKRAPLRRPATARPSTARPDRSPRRVVPRFIRSAPPRPRSITTTPPASSSESASEPIGVWMGGCWRPTSTNQVVLNIGIHDLSREQCTDGVERCLRAALAELVHEDSSSLNTVEGMPLSSKDMTVDSVRGRQGMESPSKRRNTPEVLLQVSVGARSDEEAKSTIASLEAHANKHTELGLTALLQSAARNQGLRLPKKITVILRSATYTAPAPDPVTAQSPPASPVLSPAGSRRTPRPSPPKDFQERSAKFALAALSRAMNDKEFEKKYGQSKKIRNSFKAHATGPTLELRPLHHSTCLISPRFHEVEENPALALAKELSEQTNFAFADVAEAQNKFAKLSHDTGFIDRGKFARLVSKQGVMRRDTSDALFGVFAELGRENTIEQGVMNFSGLIFALGVLQGGEGVRTMHMKSIFRYMDTSHVGVLHLMEFIKFFPGKTSDVKQIYDVFQADERGIGDCFWLLEAAQVWQGWSDLSSVLMTRPS
eukprot:TRINITY_DN17932_c0_g1_i4.p1 TRINITY_DN17932_c0_g1~~TRINITY_DN17932_c0_g1_i4.p1  ORF type:complete len:585 (+),score=77.65 TRINITY_DN17932_c0_g1_i4:14-1768(+)